MKKIIFVVFGSTGDLMKKKLIPALYFLQNEDNLKEKLEIKAIGRRDYNSEVYRDEVKKNLIDSKVCTENQITKKFLNKFEYIKFDIKNLNDYLEFKKNLDKNCEVIFYLSTPPCLFPIILEKLGQAKLNSKQNKIIFEKPFGESLKTAKELNNKLVKIFKEKQIYRIDHYLGKDSIQNFLIFRFSNLFFEPIWNNKYIDNIQITALEEMGIGNRASYYDNAGALRDMVQNHLFQMLSLITMEPPNSLEAEDIRNEKIKVFNSIKAVEEDNIVFGQYKSYKNKKEIKENSKTETFVALKLYIDNLRWHSVPFYLKTGKKLNKTGTTLIIEFKDLPPVLYNQKNNLEKNKIIIEIQPDECIKIEFNIKSPINNDINSVISEFNKKKYYNLNSPEAYQKLLLDIVNSDQSLFNRYDGVEATWKIIDKLVEFRDINKEIEIYSDNSKGPQKAEELMKKDNRKWY